MDGSLDPGKLEEEPTQSELSAHLDYGDLIVKAPKLKKGSSMKTNKSSGHCWSKGDYVSINGRSKFSNRRYYGRYKFNFR